MNYYIICMLYSYSFSSFVFINKQTDVLSGISKQMFYQAFERHRGLNFVLHTVDHFDHTVSSYTQWGHCSVVSLFEPQHDNTNKITCAHSEDSDQPGHPPGLIRVFTVRSVGSWGSNVSSSGQRRLWSDWADESSLSTHIILLVLSCSGSFEFVLYKSTNSSWPCW